MDGLHVHGRKRVSEDVTFCGLSIHLYISIKSHNLYCGNGKFLAGKGMEVGGTDTESHTAVQKDNDIVII